MRTNENEMRNPLLKRIKAFSWIAKKMKWNHWILKLYFLTDENNQKFKQNTEQTEMKSVSREWVIIELQFIKQKHMESDGNERCAFSSNKLVK